MTVKHSRTNAYKCTPSQSVMRVNIQHVTHKIQYGQERDLTEVLAATLTLYIPGHVIHCRLLFPPPGIAVLSVISIEDFRASPSSRHAEQSVLSLGSAVLFFSFSHSVITTAGEAPLLLLGDGGGYTARAKRPVYKGKVWTFRT